MKDDKLDVLKDSIKQGLEKQIAKLEKVKTDLQEDLQSCPAPEREKNQKLLEAASKLLEEMKVAQANINVLIERKSL